MSPVTGKEDKSEAALAVNIAAKGILRADKIEPFSFKSGCIIWMAKSRLACSAAVLIAA